MARNWLRSLFARPVTARITPKPRTRLGFESREARDVPAVIAGNDTYDLTYTGSPITVDTAHGVLANDDDTDDGPVTLYEIQQVDPGVVSSSNPDGSFSLSLPGLYSMVISPDRSFAVDFPNGFPGTAPAVLSFDYGVRDASGLMRATGTAEVVVSSHPINEAPSVAVPGAQVAYEDVSRPVTGIVVGDQEGTPLTITLSVAHGTLTLGSASAASITLSGSAATLNAALAGLVYRGDLNYAGPDVLSIAAADGGLTTLASVAITVKSAATQTGELNIQVNALVASGVLTNGQGKSLALDLHDNNGDAGKVQSFLNKVTALFSAGILTQEQTDALLEPGNILLTSVTIR